MEGQEDVSGPALHPSAGTRSGDVAKHVRKTIGHEQRERTQTGKMSEIEITISPLLSSN